jgi:hypothetical protein
MNTTRADFCGQAIVGRWKGNKVSGRSIVKVYCRAAGERESVRDFSLGTEIGRTLVLLVATPFASGETAFPLNR